MFKNWNQFITWEKATKDTIDVKKTYIDIADDFMAGVLLSQIVYWYLPNKQGKSKLRVKKDGHYWIAKKRSDWFEEIRFTEANYKTALKKLEKQDLVVRERFKFDGAPTTHIRLNINTFLKSINDLMEEQEQELDDDLQDFNDYLEGEIKAETKGDMDSVESTEWNWSNQPNGFGGIKQMDSVESNESLTENTTENTTKNTTENLSIQDEIKALDVPMFIQKPLMKNKDRLIDDSIDLHTIQSVYNDYKNELAAVEFGSILQNVLENTKGKIKNIQKVLTTSILNHLKSERESKEDDRSNQIKPKWFDEYQAKKFNKDSSYEQDLSQYDFSKMGNTEWLKDV